MPRGYANKFNRGEVDEGVMARDDVERVHNSSSLMDNFMPQRIGPMVYRPGTEYLGDALVNESHFLMAFVDDGTIPTILEFSQSNANPSVESLRFWLDGVLAQATGTTDTITNPSFATDIVGWTDDSSGAGSSAWEAAGRLDLTGGSADGDWGRVYQTLTVTSGERTLRVDVQDTPVRVQIGTAGSQSSDIFEDVLGFGVHLLTWTSDGSATTLTLSNDKPYSAFCSEIDYEAAGDLVVSGPMVTDTSTTGATLQTLRYTQINDVMFITDGAYDLTGYSWPFWIIKRRGNKSWSFELPNTIDGPFGPINDTSTTLTPGATSGDTTLTASNDFFDFSGTGKSTYDYYQLLHGDVYGICQVLSVTSPTVANVRIVSEFGGTTAVRDWWKGLFGSFLPSPTSAEIFEGRLYLAGGSRLYGSVSDLYTSFDELVTGDSAALTKTIGFGPVQDVSWLLGGDVLMMGLSSEEVQVSSNGDRDAITASNANVRRGTNKGSAKVRPQVVDGVIYFINRGLKKLYALSGLKAEQVAAHDTTLLHPEILDPGVKRIIYSSEPEPRMYCLLTDGSLRVLLFDNVEEVTAWSRITLGGGGTVEDLVSAPTGGEDEVYMVVERSGTRYIERLAKFSESIGGSDSRHYDSHVYESSPGSTVTGLGHLEGLTVHVWADGIEKQSTEVSAGAITLLESSWVDVVVGIRHTATWTSNKLSRYVENTVLNFRKRVVQIGLVMRSVALRNFRYGPDASTLSDMPEIDNGRPRAPTTEPEPTIVDSITGGLAVQGMEIQDDYLYAATTSVPSNLSVYNDQYMVWYDDNIYIVCGVTTGGLGSDEIWRYDVSTGAIADMTPAPAIAFSHYLAELDGVIYVTTGTVGDYLMAYDIASNTWLTVAQPTTSYTEAACGAYNGKLYMYGGNSGGVAQTNWGIYDIALDSWSYSATLGTVSALRQHAGCCPVTGTGAGKFYVYGGIDHTNADMNTLYEYDIATNTWSSLGAGPGAVRGEMQLVSGGDGYLYTFSGKKRTGSIYDKGLYRYDIGGTSWSTLHTVTDEGATHPYSRTNSGLAFDATNGRLYVYGGNNFNAPDAGTGWGEDYLPAMWYWDISGGAWTEANESLVPTGGCLRIVDISDYENLGDPAGLNMTSDVSSDDLLAYNVLPEGDYAYLIVREEDDGTLNRGIAVADISSAASPSQVGFLEGGTDVATIGRGFVKQGDHLITCSHSTNGDLAAIDVSDPTSPTLESTELTLTYTTNPVNADMMALSGNYLYIAWEDDLHIVNITDPAALTLDNTMSSAAGSATMCLIEGQWLYIAEPSLGKIHVYTLDVATAPALVGTLTDTALIGLTDMVSFSPWLYVVNETKGFVVDFRVPTLPVTHATYTGFVGLTSLASKQANVLFAGGDTGEGVIYAADQRSWLYVDYDEMSFEFNGTYETDSRVTLRATGPATVLAITYEVEDIDNPTDGSDRPR